MDANNASSGRNGVSIPVSQTILPPPVSPYGSGEGLPYAPVNWPNEGDTWGWKVGRIFGVRSGCFRDRFLIVPAHLEPPKRGARKPLQGRPQVERYLQARFPDADIDAFFASFIWSIPVKAQFLRRKGKAVSRGRTNGKMKQNQAECGQRSSREEVAQSKSTMNYEDNATVNLCSDGDETKMNDLTESLSENSQTYGPNACYLAYLESIEAQDTNRKNEYNESKTKVAQLQANIKSESLVMEEIDEKISKLQAQRDQASTVMVYIKREIAEIKSKQRMVFDCLPNVVREIQMARAQSSEWELKKKAAEDKQASILEKFAPLKGFSF